MPSFGPPLAFGPKPWMMRPRTGQRKLVVEPAVPVGFSSATGSVLGVATLALAGASACAVRCFAGAAAAGLAAATFSPLGALARWAGGAGGWTACCAGRIAGAAAGTFAAIVLAPGITRRSPIFT